MWYNFRIMFSTTADKKNTSAEKKAGKKVSLDTLSLVIDIESGLVRAALILNTPDRAPRVLDVVSSPVVRPFRHHKKRSDANSGDDFLGAMSKSLKEVVTTVANKSLPKLRAQSIDMPIAKVDCALSTPWVISKTKTVKVTYSKDTEITKDLVNKIVDGEHKLLEKQFRAEHESNIDGELLEYDLVFIEQKIFEIKLNGYSVEHVYGKKVRELEVSFAVSVSSKDILDAIHEAIANALNIVSIRGIYGVNGQYVDGYHSSLLLQYAAFRNLIKMRNDYIAAHVHNDLSDIIVVRGGVCSVLASFPFGLSTFVAKTSNKLSQSEPLTHSALAMHAGAKLTNESSRHVADASDPVIREWAAQFYQTLDAATDKESLPRILVLSVQNHFPFFERALKAEGQGVQLTITALDEGILEKAVVYEHGEQSAALVSMYAFALDPNLRAEL